MKWGTAVGKEEQLELVFERLREMLKTMNYGSVTLIVQDGKVIQLEKNEKVRIK
ncbi:YezD family protein [Metabacillus idriensis]|nr:YezD family protein [Metabacillus idriensis]MDR0137298.1 YezD family protein [Metabacillus idriensis]